MAKISSPAMLQWQLDRLTGQLMLVGDHYADQSCPCTYGYSDPTGKYISESCIPKHLLCIYEYCVETAVMTDDEELKALLTDMAEEARETRNTEMEKVCGREVEQIDITEWARDKRKLLEPHIHELACSIPGGEKTGTLYCCSYRMKPTGEVLLTCRKNGGVLEGLYPNLEDAKKEAAQFCGDAPVEEALVLEVAKMFRKKAEPRWCYPVKQTDKELGKLFRTLGAAKKRITLIQRHLEMPLNICRGQAEMFEGTTGVLDPYGSRCRDPGTGQWVYSEECGFEPAGITTTALGMDGLTQYEFEFKLVSLDKLIVSHDPFTFAPNPNYPAELQPRLRERAATKIQVEKIASNLEPDAVITDFHVIDRGTPIVGPDLVVEAGNGRVMGIIRAAADYPDKYSAYKDRLRERAHDYGLNAKDVDSMETPVLIRVRITDVDRNTFAQEANQAATIAPSAIENARTDAQKITLGMLQELIVGENESLEDALRAPKNQAFAKRFLTTLPENVQAALVDAQGYLNRDGVHRMAMGVFVSAFQGDAGLRLAEKAFESIDMDVRNTVNAIARSLGTLAQAEALTRAGERDTTLSIGDDLAQTINVYSAIKRNPALTVEKYLAQKQIFARELTPFQERILMVLDEYSKSPKKLAGVFTAYAEGVINAPPPAQAALFPGAEITKEGLWESAIKAPEPQPALMEEVARMFNEIELAERWVKRWRVPSSSGEGHWIVAIDKDGNYGCSCPVWKFRRQECHHIKQVKAGGGEPMNGGEPKKRPEYILARVLKPIHKEETNELLIPLVALGPEGTHMEATICYYMLKHGYSIGEIRQIRHLPKGWTAEAIYDHIEQRGEAEYPEDWYPSKRGVAAVVRMFEKTGDKHSVIKSILDMEIWLGQLDLGKTRDRVKSLAKLKMDELELLWRDLLATKYDWDKNVERAVYSGLGKKVPAYLQEETAKVARLFAPMKLLTKEIRDKLPPLYSQEKVEDPMVWVKFFTPDSNWTWYATEFDGKDTFFGWVVGFEKELGNFSLKELESARGPMGLAIERDKWFTPQPLSEVKKLHQAEHGELGDRRHYFCDWLDHHPHREIIQVLTDEEDPKCPYCKRIMTYGAFWGPAQAKAALAQGTMGAIGSAAITGIGIGAGFKFIDWVAGTFSKRKLKEGEMGDDIIDQIAKRYKELEIIKADSKAGEVDISYFNGQQSGLLWVGYRIDEPRMIKAVAAQLAESKPEVHDYEPSMYVTRKFDKKTYVFYKHVSSDKEALKLVKQLTENWNVLAIATSDNDIWIPKKDAPLLINPEFLKKAGLKEKAPYARQVPAYVDVFETTIEKHYLPPEDFHEGSIRVVKSGWDILVYLGCLKADDWNGERCSPNPTVLKTIVPNNKYYLDELEHLKLVHPEIKVNYRTDEVGVEPVVSEGEQEELEAVDEALEHAEAL